MEFFLGGFGSGKSYTLVRKALKLASYNRGYMGAILMPRIEDLKRPLLPVIICACLSPKS